MVVSMKIENFLKHVKIVDSGCWEWTYTITNKGYGFMWYDSKFHLTHRIIYEYYYGQICPDLQIDHLCRNRKCCNPFHLEQVTQKENILRGVSFSAINARKTCCLKGHEFTLENTYIRPDGRRNCRICAKLKMRDRRCNLYVSPRAVV